MSYPFAYPVVKREQEFSDYISYWLELKKKSKVFDRYYDHWILGKNTKDREPRWSVIRNLLGWVE